MSPIFACFKCRDIDCAGDCPSDEKSSAPRKGSVADLRAQLADVTAERDALKADFLTTLKRFGAHRRDCAAWGGWADGSQQPKCSCGFDEAKAALSPAQANPSCVCGHPEESHPSEYQRVTPRLAGKCARCECTRFR